MKMAVMLDPLDQLKPLQDTSLHLMKTATALGWDCYYFEQSQLFCRDGQAYAEVHQLRIGDLATKHWAQQTCLGECPLTLFDIILMRQDPPFDLEYVYATYALDLAEKQGVVVANKPQSIRDANEKFYTLQVPQCCPPTLVTQDRARLRAFWQQYQDVIFKPLNGLGGAGIFHVDPQGQNLPVILEQLTNHGCVSIMAQQYIPAISTAGDKRILLINGEPVAYGLARMPAENDFRGNLAAGAQGQVVPITARDRWLCQELAPLLRAKGLWLVGIDVIGDYITEINVTSPTCMVEIETASGIPVAEHYLTFLSSLITIA